jgi:hypothetical protein
MMVCEIQVNTPYGSYSKVVDDEGTTQVIQEGLNREF